MKTATIPGVALLLALPLVWGCPGPDDGSPVHARIAASATRGPAPLTVTFSAASSTSDNGGTLTYLWNFGDGATATDVSATHVFDDPGRYTVRLTVTDETGASGEATQEIRAAGTGATAVIQADLTSGPAPLLVQFDGTLSSAPDDTIYDYFWSFGDGATSQTNRPVHQYQFPGTYTVTLRVVTGGGVEAEATTTITVSQSSASLLFDGSAYATLPLAAAQSLTTFTFEAWVKADSEGGPVVTVGAGVLSLQIEPASSRIRLTLGGTPTDATATNVGGTWRHVAVVYNGNDLGGGQGNCALYLDGGPLVSTAVTGALSVDRLTLGVGLRGKLAEIRLFNTARTAAEIQATMATRLSGTEAGLLGYWRLDEGLGQVLDNRGSDGTDGVLGAAAATDGADPAWSTDGPPL